MTIDNKDHDSDSSAYLIKLLREQIGITISVTIAEIGYAPDDLGPPVKEILAGTDEIAIIVLGCGLDEARAKGNWKPVRKVVKDIRERQNENKKTDTAEGKTNSNT